MEKPVPLPPTDGRLADNIVHFTRALRKAGVKVGTAQVEEAVRAVHTVGFTKREDFYHTLRAVLIKRPEHLLLYDQVFAMFWRDPDYVSRMIHMFSPSVRKDEEPPKKKAAERRAAESLTEQPELPHDVPPREELEIDAKLSWSANETLRAMDFEQMSTEEAAAAARLIKAIKLPLPTLKNRRRRKSAYGVYLDSHATMRAAFRRGGEISTLVKTEPRQRHPDLVVLCDISGSMTAYARMMMHFLHSLSWAAKGAPARQWGNVHAFTFGTRLTNITRALAKRDVDAALDAVADEAKDWQGGTRIGDALACFNKRWSRRVLSRGAVVMLISDGLERGDLEHLRLQAERLALSSKRLIWLNPLLRYEAFAPEAGGIKALLPQVDGLYACHSLASLEQLADVFSSRPSPLAA
ncbi:MAG: VWA domain-containing protein [Pseudomonadota bacterium]